MTVFFVIVGVSIVGIGVVIWLMIKDKDESESSVEKLAPEDLEDFKDKPFIKQPQPAAKETRAKKGSFLAKLKFGKKKPQDETETPLEQFPADDQTKPKKSLFGKLFARKNKDLDGFPADEETDDEGKKGFLKKIFAKLKFGRKKSDDDIPQATSFPSLKDKLNSFSKNKDAGKEPAADTKKNESLPLLKDIDTGTASLQTQKSEQPKESAGKYDTAKPPPKAQLSADEQEQIKKEVEAATELAELKSKYDKMENLLTEKNEELGKIKGSFDHEVGHRKDFNKIKDLLERELKEVKERVKASKVELSNIKVENENYQKRINQLEEKATKLEKEILHKEEEIDNLRKNESTPPPEQPEQKKEEKPVVEPKQEQPPEADASVPAPEKPEKKEIEIPAQPAKPQAEEVPETKPVPPAPKPEKEHKSKKPSDQDISKFEESLGITTSRPKSNESKPAEDNAPKAQPEIRKEEIKEGPQQPPVKDDKTIELETPKSQETLSSHDRVQPPEKKPEEKPEQESFLEPETKPEPKPEPDPEPEPEPKPKMPPAANTSEPVLDLTHTETTMDLGKSDDKDEPDDPGSQQDDSGFLKLSPDPIKPQEQPDPNPPEKPEDNENKKE